MAHARGQIQVNMWEETPYGESVEGPRLVRVAVAETFSGDVDGTGEAIFTRDVAQVPMLGGSQRRRDPGRSECTTFRFGEVCSCRSATVTGMCGRRGEIDRRDGWDWR